jgi:hypothetical protein
MQFMLLLKADHYNFLYWFQTEHFNFLALVKIMGPENINTKDAGFVHESLRNETNRIF